MCVGVDGCPEVVLQKGRTETWQGVLNRHNSTVRSTCCSTCLFQKVMIGSFEYAAFFLLSSSFHSCDTNNCNSLSAALCHWHGAPNPNCFIEVFGIMTEDVIGSGNG